MGKGEWKNNTPAPSPTPPISWHFPAPEDTGIIEVKKGETIVEAIIREGPKKVFNTAIPFECKVVIRMDVTETLAENTP